jgi:GNAT superfamily N-acetyltransferase
MPSESFKNWSARRVAATEIIDLRHRVLRAGLPRQSANFPGDDDPATVHFAVSEDGRVIGCATAIDSKWEREPAIQVRGMAVDQACRGRGIGEVLLGEIERLASARGVKLLWANCRTPAAGFYSKAGWTKVSEEFEIPTAGPHFKMVRRL